MAPVTGLGIVHFYHKSLVPKFHYEKGLTDTEELSFHSRNFGFFLKVASCNQFNPLSSMVTTTKQPECSVVEIFQHRIISTQELQIVLVFVLL